MAFLSTYSWPVPVAFREPLERQRLQIGDVFYDHIDAYTKEWGEALKVLGTSMQVVSSTGFDVKVAIFRPNRGKTALEKVKEEVLTYEELYLRLGAKKI